MLGGAEIIGMAWPASVLLLIGRFRVFLLLRLSSQVIFASFS